MRIFITGIAVLLLAGCATSPGQIANEARDACIKQGATVESGQLYDCMRSLEQAAIADNERSAARANYWANVFWTAGAAAARSSVREGGGYDVHCTGIQNGPYTYTNCR